MLSQATALIAHKRIIQQNYGEPQFVKIDLTIALGEIKIIVKTLTGKKIQIECNPVEDNIEALKGMI